MSTKLQHGYRLAEGVDIWTFTDLVRQTMNPVRERLDATLLMKSAVSAVDATDARNEPRPAHALLDAMNSFEDKQREMNPAHRGHDPHRFEVSFGQDRVENGGDDRILMLLYVDQAEYVQAWEALSAVEPYGYWNNTDRPDEVSAAEWDARCAAWARMMPNGAPPVETMISFSLRADIAHDIGMYRLVMPRPADAEDARRLDVLRAAAPSKRSRARDLAVTTICQQALQRDPDADLLRLMSSISYGRSADPAYQAIIDTAEGTLRDDVIEHVLTAQTEPGDPHPIDLDAVRDAATAFLDQPDPSDGEDD